MTIKDPKKALMIIAHKDFRDEEFLEPKKILEKNGYTVMVASSSAGEARGILGASVTPDMIISEVIVEEYQVIVFVGGAGAKEYWRNEKALEIVRNAVLSKVLLGAICIAPITLANAGVLEGKKATVFPSEAKGLISKGVQYTGNEVEQDGLIITASGPQAAKEFGSALVQALDTQTN